jgi:hypothetical protein
MVSIYIMINRKYVPPSLSKKDKQKQIRSIKQKTDRPKVKFQTKRSPHVIRFEKKFGFPITSKKREQIMKPEGIRQILAKGRAAYYNAGSRPNVTPSQWSLARLAAVLSLNGAARRVDRKIYDKYIIKPKK